MNLHSSFMVAEKQLSANKMVGIKPPSLQQIWRFSSAHFYREVISETNNLFMVF